MEEGGVTPCGVRAGVPEGQVLVGTGGEACWRGDGQARPAGVEDGEQRARLWKHGALLGAQVAGRSPQAGNAQEGPSTAPLKASRAARGPAGVAEVGPWDRPLPVTTTTTGDGSGGANQAL